MKKLSEERRHWLVIHAERSARSRLHSKAKLKARRTGIAMPHLPMNRNELRIAAPRILSLADNYDETRSFFSAVVDMIENGRRAMVDFTPIRQVAPGAALSLAAILDMWQRINGRRLLARGARQWRPEVRQTLAELGLFDLLKTPNPPTKILSSAPVTRMLKFRSGEGSDGSLAAELAQAMIDIAGPIEAQRFLYVGLTEAMTNVAQHAYPEAAFEGVPPNYRRWWMTGSYDEQRRRMRILILDLGIGIPATLPRSSNWERIRGLIASVTGPDDAEMIAAAVEAGRSSTGAAGRGNGLQEIRQFVEQSASGRLRILSGRGEVTYEKGSGRPGKRTFSEPMMGTLIEWEVFR